MTADEIKNKIKAFLTSTLGDEIDVDFDSLEVKRVDDGVFKVGFLCTLDEDEEEEDEDIDDMEDVEARDEDFDD